MTARIASSKGVTLSELLVALTIALTVVAGVVKLADEARVFFRVQPEVMDQTQRARVGVDLLVAELTNAGAGASLGPVAVADPDADAGAVSGTGPGSGTSTTSGTGAGVGTGSGADTEPGADVGALLRWIPPILPARYQGSGASDPSGVVFHDRLTIVTTTESVPLVALRGGMATPTAPLPIAAQPGCPVADDLCGFRDGQRIALFDRFGAFDLATVRSPTAVPGAPPGSATALLSHDPLTLARAFREEDDARVVKVRAVTLYHDATRNQLRRATGPRADAPVLDDVVGLAFRYFGDRAPPASPRPPPGASNCLFDADGVSTLPSLAPDDGDQAELTDALLTDGPWCSATATGGGASGGGPTGGASGTAFDADLYRLRRIRVTLRIQANAPWARGRDPNFFQRPGTGTSAKLLVPDYVITFDVSPRNLQTG